MVFGLWFKGFLLLCQVTEGRQVKHWSGVITNGFRSVASGPIAPMFSDWRTTSADSASCFELQDTTNVTVRLLFGVCNIRDPKKATTVTAKERHQTKELMAEQWLCMCAINLCIQLFRESLSFKRWKAYATMSKVIMGNGGFYGCLIELQGVSAWRKETAQTRVFLLSRSLLLNHLEPQSSQIKLLLPIMPIDIVAYAFRLLWDNLCRNNCKALCEISSRLTDWFKTTGAWCNGLSSRYQQSQ